MLPLMLLAVLAQAPPVAGDAAVVSGMVEGRPGPAARSPLQALVDRARPGDRVDVARGTYRGDLIIDKPLQLVGHDRPVLIGSGTGSVVRVRAADVTIDGFDIDGLGGGDLGRDASGVHVAARRATIRNCGVRNTLFGIYLREADGATVRHCDVHGIPGREPGEKGSGIHVWNTVGFTLEDNEIVDVRDGFYIQSSSHGHIARNRAHDLRYGLHYMFSDDNTFEDNLFERGAAGTALMYSKRIVFRRNRFLHNRGFASVGLLFKSCEDVLAEDNLVADNARGIFLEGSYRDHFRRNVIAQSDIAIVLYDTEGGHRFEGNVFVANLSPLLLVGRHTDTAFDGNYWSDNDEPDLDGDGRSDRPYALTNVFDHLRGNLTAADLMAQGFAATAIGMAERAFPIIVAPPVADHAPLVRAPVLPMVPRAGHEAGDRGPVALGLSLVAAACGLGIFRHARTPGEGAEARA
jgi:nitrous oxidase accessory protein